MNLISVTINHKTAPIELREALYFSENEIRENLRQLKESLFKEACILSTCNRTEIYGIPADQSTTFRDIQNYLLDKKPIEGITSNNFLNYFSCGAVNHLFHVTAGIDSLVIGDQQILGQVKDSFNIAVEENSVGTYLQKAFQSALKVGKRVKSETDLFEGPTSVSAAAVQLAGKIFSDLTKKSVLVIGAGETGKLTIQNLIQKKVSNLTISNRTSSRAEKLAEKNKAKVLPFENLKNSLHEFDIIISATSSKSILISREEMNSVMRKRKFAPVCIMDIAIPRDFDSNIKDIENIFYNDIDSLQSMVNLSIEGKKVLLPSINKIIMEELIELFSWYNSLQISPILKAIREQFESVRSQEFETFKNKFNVDERENLELLTKRIMNKLLHNPTVYLRKSADQVDTQGELQLKINILKEMFNLNSKGNESE
ncbi:MAG: glutamyl-tRNA reductase [Bacteroidetes bacterium]|nr:glutamyl-tRNA reductase [Bacteroidota bacterium]MBU2585638.1 glutamyl-tRNA reductase [Bacteroidota bacterium]